MTNDEDRFLLSLAPGFSRVGSGRQRLNRFSGFEQLTNR